MQFYDSKNDIGIEQVIVGMIALGNKTQEPVVAHFGGVTFGCSFPDGRFDILHRWNTLRRLFQSHPKSTDNTEPRPHRLTLAQRMWPEAAKGGGNHEYIARECWRRVAAIIDTEPPLVAADTATPAAAAQPDLAAEIVELRRQLQEAQDVLDKDFPITAAKAAAWDADQEWATLGRYDTTDPLWDAMHKADAKVRALIAAQQAAIDPDTLKDRR